MTDRDEPTRTHDGFERELRLRRGELVEVRSAEEILATLDERGCLDALPFMPEMLRYCGKRFRVRASAHKTCDTVRMDGGRRMEAAVHLEDLRCDGSSHGGCQAACLLFWKDAWLRRVPEEPEPLSSRLGRWRRRRSTGPGCSQEDLAEAVRAEDESDLASDPRYACQATELVRATTRLPAWDVRQYVRDLTSGNIGLFELLNGLYYRFTSNMMQIKGYRAWRALYDAVQRLVGGSPYPRIEGSLRKTPSESLELQAGEEVEVKRLEEIVATLDTRNRNRGMTFDKEMAPFCGERHRVLQRVERIIDESTGRLVELPNACIMLEGVVCRSRYSDRRIGCPRAIYSYWRECWLRRVDPSHE